MSRNRSPSGFGFTLLEVVFGMALFATVAISFILFLQSSAKESQFSGEHLTALILSQKVLEDIGEEVFVNPYGFETLGIEGSSPNLEVTEGKSVFFSYLEDRKAPWGRIDPAIDGMITPKMLPLYEAVAKYRFQVEGKRLQASGDGEDRNVMNCGVGFSWSARTGSGKFANRCLYFSPVTAKKQDLSAMVDEPGLDRRSPEEFFRKPGQSLLEIAAQSGVPVEDLRDLGRVALVTQDFLQSPPFRDLQKKTSRLRARIPTIPPDSFDALFDARLQLAQSWYELAKLSFQIVAFVERPVSRFARENTFKSLHGAGIPAIEPIAFQRALFNVKLIYSYFTASLIQSRDAFQALLQKDIAGYKGGKTQLQIMQKLFDLHRLIAIIPTCPDGMAEYRKFLAKVEGFAEGRNPFLHRMVRQEEVFLGDRTVWLNRWANLKRLDGILNDRMPGILVFIDLRTKGSVLDRPSPPDPLQEIPQ